MGSGPWAEGRLGWAEGSCLASGPLWRAWPRRTLSRRRDNSMRKWPGIGTTTHPQVSAGSPTNSKMTSFCPSMTGGVSLNMLVWSRGISNSCTESCFSVALSWHSGQSWLRPSGPPHSCPPTGPLPVSSGGVGWFNQHDVLKRIQLVLISTNLVNFN